MLSSPNSVNKYELKLRHYSSRKTRKLRDGSLPCAILNRWKPIIRGPTSASLGALRTRVAGSGILYAELNTCKARDTIEMRGGLTQLGKLSLEN